MCVCEFKNRYFFLEFTLNFIIILLCFFLVDVLNTCPKKDFVLSSNNGLLIHIHCTSILISNFMKDDNNDNFLNLYYFPNFIFLSWFVFLTLLSDQVFTQQLQNHLTIPIPKFILLHILLAIHWTLISLMNTCRIYFFLFIAAFRV